MEKRYSQYNTNYKSTKKIIALIPECMNAITKYLLNQ